MSISVIMENRTVQKELANFLSFSVSLSSGVSLPFSGSLISGVWFSDSLFVQIIKKVEPERITFSLFPFPSIELSNITINKTPISSTKINKTPIQNTQVKTQFLQNTTIEKVLIFFSPKALFSGKIVITKVSIKNPFIPLSASLLSIPFNGDNLFDHFSKEQGDLSIEINNLTSDTFKKANMSMLISPLKKSLSADIKLYDLILRDLITNSLPNLTKNSLPDLTKSSLPDLTIKKIDKNNEVIGKILVNEQQTTIKIDSNGIEPFYSNFAIEFKHDKKKEKTSLILSGKDVNVEQVRASAINFMPKNPISNKIFDILEGGTAKNIEIVFQNTTSKYPVNGKKNGKNYIQKTKSPYLLNTQTIKNIFHPHTMTIKAHLRNGTIKIPVPKLSEKHLTDRLINILKARETDGVINVKNGVLHTQIIRGRINTSKVIKGTLEVNLLNEDHDFKGEFNISADLAHLNQVLQVLLPKSVVSKELALLSDIKGKTEGILKLKGKKCCKPSIFVTTRDITLKGKYPRLPNEFSITGGKFNYNDKLIEIVDLKGSVGKSYFSNLSGALTLKANQTLKASQTPNSKSILDEANYLLNIKSCKAKIIIEEVLPWLSALFGGSSSANSSILPVIAHSTGTINLTETAFKGKLMVPETWDYFFQGDCDGITLKQQIEKITLNQQLNKDAISDIKANFLISPSMIKIFLKSAIIQETSLISLLLNNQINYSKLINDIKTPFQIKNIYFEQKSNINAINQKDISINGKFIFNENLQLYLNGEIDLYQNKEIKPYQNREIKPYQNKEIKLYQNRPMKGNTSSNYQIKVFEKGIESATISYNTQSPSVKFTGNINTDTIKEVLNPISKTYQSFISMTGAKKFLIESSQSGIYNISTDELDLNFILEKEKLIKQKLIALPLSLKEPTPSLNQSTPSLNQSTPLSLNENQSTIILTLNCDKFTHKKIIISPFSARITLNGKDKEINIDNMHLCNINTLTSIKIKDNIMKMFINLKDDNKNIEPVISCLYHGKRLMKGNYSLKASLYSSALLNDTMNIANLKENLTGKIELTSENGRIFRLTLLSRILSVINISKLMEGKFPDIEQNGFGFNLIKIVADVEKSKIILRQAVIKGVDMTFIFVGWIDPFTRKIDLTCLVAPFKTADNIIENIPIINTMLNGRLISVPVKVTGTLNNPDVTVINPSEIAKSILNTMRDILTTPFKLINILN